MKEPTRLLLDSLRVAYGRSVVLDGLSLEVVPGEFMVLLGPSGCGKSTLLAAVAGLAPLASGRVVLGGRDITDLDPADRDVALVFQSYALYPTMTVEKNITFGMRMRGVPRTERARQLAETTRMLQLEALLQRKPSQLSGGQRQRVAIARALVRDPDLFLFDEPLSNLDAQLRTNTRSELKLLHQRLGTTTLYVTHDQAEAMTLASRIAVMRAGRIQQVGDPQAIYDRPETVFVARFVGAAGMNIVPAQLADDGLALETGGLRLDISDYRWTRPPEPGRPVLLGIRPEDVRLARGDAGVPVMLAPVLIEPTGADSLLRLPFAGQTIVGRADRSSVLAPGQPAPFTFNLGNASIFCPQTERRL